MKDDNVSERAAALLHEALDVLQRVENAPDSPVNTFMPGKMRRLLRRGAERLRRGEAQPKYRNLFNAEQLADIYQKTIQRDETREQTVADFERIGCEIARAIDEDGPAVRKTIEAIYLQTLRSARENGPDSEAAQRLRQLRSLVRIAKQSNVDSRRQKHSRPFVRTYSHEAQGRIPLIPAEVLASPPLDEAVIAIPPDGRDSGRPRVFLRIGLGEASWVGSFEIGHMSVSTIFIMPDGKHLFVSAEGAGYIIEVKSRRLVEEIGTDVAGVMAEDSGTLFIVDHNGHEPGSIRKQRPPLENGHDQLRRISGNSTHRHRVHRRSTTPIAAGVDGFLNRPGDGQRSFRRSVLTAYASCSTPRSV